MLNRPKRINKKNKKSDSVNNGDIPHEIKNEEVLDLSYSDKAVNNTNNDFNVSQGESMSDGSFDNNDKSKDDNKNDKSNDGESDLSKFFK